MYSLVSLSPMYRDAIGQEKDIHYLLAITRDTHNGDRENDLGRRHLSSQAELMMQYFCHNRTSGLKKLKNDRIFLFT